MSWNSYHHLSKTQSWKRASRRKASVRLFVFTICNGVFSSGNLWKAT